MLAFSCYVSMVLSNAWLFLSLSLIFHEVGNFEDDWLGILCNVPQFGFICFFFKITDLGKAYQEWNVFLVYHVSGTCLSSLGRYNKMLQAGELTNNRILFLIVPGAGSWQSGHQHGYVRVLFQAAEFLYLTNMEGMRDFSQASCIKALIYR